MKKNKKNFHPKKALPVQTHNRPQNDSQIADLFIGVPPVTVHVELIEDDKANNPGHSESGGILDKLLCEV